MARDTLRMTRIKGCSLLEVMLVLMLMTFASMVHLRWELGQLYVLEAQQRRYEARQLLDESAERMTGFTLLTPALSGSVSDYQSIDSNETLISGAEGSYRLVWQVNPEWSDGNARMQGALPDRKDMQLSIHWQEQGRENSMVLEQALAALMRPWQ